MEWGIINEENFKDIYDIPIKRWDPLSTVKIKSKDFGFKNENIRYYGHYAYLSPIRGRRPVDYKIIHDTNNIKNILKTDLSNIKDVFTSVIEGEIAYNDHNEKLGDGYTIILCEGSNRRDNPFHEIPHQIKKISKNHKALTLINRYPSMARIVKPEIEKYIKENLPNHLKLAKGINLISLSRDFYPSMYFKLIPDDVLIAILLSMKEAIIYSIQESINRDYFDIPVSPFFNIGMRVGGSQPRIHGQVYIDLNMDGHGSRLEGFLEAFQQMGENCHLCKTSHEHTDRIILKTNYWTFYTSGSPIRNYHIRFHPNEHIRRFTKLNINQISDFARNLKNIFLALDDINIEKNRNILFNGCPYHYDADFHMFGDIIPHEIIGGAEMAEDMRVARKLPHIAAREIRGALKRYQ